MPARLTYGVSARRSRRLVGLAGTGPDLIACDDDTARTRTALQSAKTIGDVDLGTLSVFKQPGRDRGWATRHDTHLVK